MDRYYVFKRDPTDIGPDGWPRQMHQMAGPCSAAEASEKKAELDKAQKAFISSMPEDLAETRWSWPSSAKPPYEPPSLRLKDIAVRTDYIILSEAQVAEAQRGGCRML